MGNQHGDMATGVSRVGSQGGGGSVRDIYHREEECSGIYRSGARGSRNVGANHGPGLGGGGGNVGAIYGSGAGGGGNIGSIYRDVEGREGNVAIIYRDGERREGNVAIIYRDGAGGGSNHRAGRSLRGNIGAIYAPGARSTGGNIDEIFLPGPGSGGTVSGSSRDGV